MSDLFFIMNLGHFQQCHLPCICVLVCIRCSIDGVEDKRIVGMQLDKQGNSLFVAFSSCVVKVPLSRCEWHGKCKK